MRGFILACWYGIGPIVVIFLSIFVSYITNSGIMAWIFFAVGLWFIYYYAKVLKQIGRIKMDSWLSSVEGCDYKYAWDGTGIAVDAANKKIHLTSMLDKRAVSKEYPFNDVREWGYEMPGAATSGKVVGGGVQGASHNLGAAMSDIGMAFKAAENTGLWLKVRDIDWPKWFIKFRCDKVQDKNTETELNRWMEILRQSINQDGKST